MAKKKAELGKNQKFVRDLKMGDVVTINGHDYYFKGIMDVIENKLKKKQVTFWSVTTDFKKYFNLDLLEHIVTVKKEGDGFNW